MSKTGEVICELSETGEVRGEMSKTGEVRGEMNKTGDKTLSITLNVRQDACRSIKDLETEIVELETIKTSTGNQGYIEVLKSKKMAVANLLETKIQDALVRSRILNISEMDAPSSFFFGLEKKKGQKKVMNSL